MANENFSLTESFTVTSTFPDGVTRGFVINETFRVREQFVHSDGTIFPNEPTSTRARDTWVTRTVPVDDDSSFTSEGFGADDA